MYFARTYDSLCYGILSPEALVGAAVARGIQVLCRTDINATAAAYPF